jgi:hypothetical protein
MRFSFVPADVRQLV